MGNVKLLVPLQDNLNPVRRWSLLTNQRHHSSASVALGTLVAQH